MLLLPYFLLLLFYTWFWRKSRETYVPDNYVPCTNISVLVAARDEAANIKACLEGLVSQCYPRDLLEIWLCDDHSTDGTLEIARSFQSVSSTGNPGEGKKAALRHLIQQSKGELLVFTDADCKVPEYWLREIAFVHETQSAKCICGPVVFSEIDGWFERFQAIDFLGMMGITAAGIRSGAHHLANGANLAYTREAWTEIQGTNHNTGLASGDDVFVAQAIAHQWPGQVSFLKSVHAIVETPAEHSIGSFWRQRIRWASKTGAYTEWPLVAAQGIVWASCWLIWLIFLGALLGWCSFGTLAIYVLTKFLMDILFALPLIVFFKRKNPLFSPLSLVVSFACQTLYYPLVGTYVLLVRKAYKWKGRIVR